MTEISVLVLDNLALEFSVMWPRNFSHVFHWTSFAFKGRLMRQILAKIMTIYSDFFGSSYLKVVLCV